MLLAAVPDAWIIGFPIVMILAQFVQVSLLLYVNSKTQRITTLEADVKKAAGEAIDNRLIALRAEQLAPISVLNNNMAAVHMRLADGETAFRKLREKDSMLEVQFIERLSQLKQLISETCATKDDLREMEDRLNERKN